MKRASHSVISGFFVRAILWLIPCLALWYLGRNYVAVAPAWLARSMAKLAVSRLVLIIRI